MDFNDSNNLPISHPNTNHRTIRKRLSSLSLKLRPSTISSSLRRCKSVPSHIGESSLKRWWDKGWSWIMSRKPVFAKDLEMNEEETQLLGCHYKGSWRHVFYKIRSRFRKIVSPSRKVGLPQTYRYSSFDYSKNFDDGDRSP